MPTKAYGRMVFWEGASLWVLGTRPGEGPYPKTKFHAHHAVQVTLSLRGWFTLENRDRQVGGEAAAVAPDTEHALAGEGMVAHLYVDPEGEPGRELQRTLFCGESLVSLPAPGLAGLPAHTTPVASVTGTAVSFVNASNVDAVFVAGQLRK